MSDFDTSIRQGVLIIPLTLATIEYQKVVWAVAFRVLEEALPIDSMHKSSFINLVCELFIDPRIATWQKQLLSRGMECLIVHSCSYSPKFRQTALECFDTYQLRPLHLKYALSVYTTCVFREIQEGGEFAYAINKTFEQEFQKLLNVFSFYSSSSEKLTFDIAQVLASVVCLVWKKETIIDIIWNMVAPIAASINNQSVMRQNSRNKVYESIDSLSEQSTQNSEKFANTIISQFDKSLLFLLHKILLKLATESLNSCFELCSKIIFPKLSKVHDTSFAQSLMLLIMCSVSDNPMVYNRIYLVLPTDNYSHELESLSMDVLANDLMNCFIATAQSNGFKWSKAALLQIFSQVVFNNDTPKEDPQRISIFKPK